MRPNNIPWRVNGTNWPESKTTLAARQHLGRWIHQRYIYYAPTREQLLNPGYAQEDCDCLLAPEWQSDYEQHAVGLLKKL